MRKMYDVQGNVLPYLDEQLADQEEDSCDDNDRIDDDCTEEVSVNSW